MIDFTDTPAAPPQHRPSPGSNAKQRRLARLRSTALDEQESPLERIEAARKILQKHGPSGRNVPIIRTVIKCFIRSLDGDIAYRTAKLRARLAKLLELKAVKLPDAIENTEIEIASDSTDLRSISLEPGMIHPADPWDAPPPLPLDEQFRLIECQRSSVTGRALLSIVLDGREPTVETLNKLFLHLTKSCEAGGCALAQGSLYEEVKKILIAHGTIPASNEQASRFGTDLLAELNAR